MNKNNMNEIEIIVDAIYKYAKNNEGDKKLVDYIDDLEAYINSHYIEKEKVLGLKMEGEYYEVDPYGNRRILGSGMLKTYGQAVSEINKAVDSLVGGEDL